MSAQTDSSKYIEYHGIKLATGGAIANANVERLDNDPSTLTPGRVWFNNTDKKFKFVSLDGAGAAKVAVFSTAAELAAAIQAEKDLLASIVAGEGSAKIGYKGLVGANGQLTIAAANLEAALDELITDLDAFMQAQQDASNQLATDLAKTAQNDDGAKLVGYEGETGVNGHITVAAGTVSDSLDAIVTQTDAAIEAANVDALSKTELTDQTVESNVTFNKSLVVTQDLTVLGSTINANATTVELGDNILELNALATGIPSMDAGLSVNRGDSGVLNFLIWDESGKELIAPRLKESAFGIAEGLVADDLEVRVILGDEFDKQKTTVDAAIASLEDRVGDSIGDLTTLDTVAKDTLVNSINEVHGDVDTNKADLADNIDVAKGAALVGYAGPFVGANNHITIATGTVKSAIEKVASEHDILTENMEQHITLVQSTTAGEGAYTIGYKGQGVVTDSFYLPAGNVQDSLGAITTEIVAVKADVENAVNGTDALIAAINAKQFVATSISALSHTINHALGTQDIEVQLWIKDGQNWVNHQAHTEVTDDNNVVVTLTDPADIKVIVRAATAVSIA